MHGDRRPYPVALITLDPEEILPWAQEQDLPQDMAKLAATDPVRELVQVELDRAKLQLRPGRADQEVRDPRPGI